MHNMFSHGGAKDDIGEKRPIVRLWNYIVIRKRWISLILVALMGQLNTYGDAYSGFLSKVNPFDSATVADVSGLHGGPQLKPEFILPSPTPAATPTPVGPRLNAGSFWFDKPISDDQGDPANMGNVSGQSYEVIGIYGCWPLPYLGYTLRIQVKDQPSQWWVSRTAVDMSDEELQEKVTALQKSAQFKPDANCQ